MLPVRKVGKGWDSNRGRRVFFPFFYGQTAPTTQLVHLDAKVIFPRLYSEVSNN